MSQQKTILCVDDESDILELFRDEFIDCGHHVLEALNGVEAFKVFQENHIDCIVSDIRMPGGDGVELVRKVKETGSSIPVFLVTGFSDYTSEELAGQGVNAVVFKPFDLEEVVEMVQKSLGQS